VADMQYLSQQIVLHFRTQWDARKPASTGEPAKTPLSTRIFISSDMDVDEYTELSRLVESKQGRAQGVHAKWPVATLVRFEPSRVRAELHEGLSDGLHEFLSESSASSTTPPNARSTHPSTLAVEGSTTPLTPFHVLLVDALIAELAAAGHGGFTGTSQSYVSELIFLSRVAHGIEEVRDNSGRDLLKGGSAPEGFGVFPSASATTAATLSLESDVAASAKPADAATPAESISIPVPNHPADTATYTASSSATKPPPTPITKSGAGTAHPSEDPVLVVKKKGKVDKKPIPVKVRTNARRDKDEL
jgi:hypothetical protein